MERIDYRDVDFYLQQVESAAAEKPLWEKKEEERRLLCDVTMWIPTCFSLADRETAEKIFWSREIPEFFFITQDGTAGITMQSIEEKIQSPDKSSWQRWTAGSYVMTRERRKVS